MIESDITKITDTGAYLADVRAGGSLRSIEIVPGGWVRFVSPAIFVVAVGNDTINVLIREQPIHWWQYLLFALYAAGLVAMVPNMRAKTSPVLSVGNAA